MNSTVSDEIERLSAHILASETWAKQYEKTPELHAKLIRTETKLDRKIRKFFHDLSLLAPSIVNWNAYLTQVQNNQTLASRNIKAADSNYQVDVIVNDTPIDNSTREFIRVILEEITTATALGAQSGEELYGIKLGLGTTDAAIQHIALQHSAQLVGKTVLPDGSIVDNTLKGLDITEKTRANIRQSIHTSIAMGENVADATARLQNVIDDADRAELIARTEVVNSFGQGLSEYGRQSDAVGKEWQDTGADDICADNTAAGPIPFDEDFPSGDSEPTAHPNCRCSMRLIYQNELDDNPDLFG